MDISPVVERFLRSAFHYYNMMQMKVKRVSKFAKLGLVCVFLSFTYSFNRIFSHHFRNFSRFLTPQIASTYARVCPYGIV